ncbi:MAG: sporulation protein Cse60 [Candidatus Sumerlaeia bacterium]|nr:sporulation protein Cse60 [Candidatus Sumerlaeia bacterium]
MFLQCKYIRATEGWDLEQQVNAFIQKLPRESLIDIKFHEHQAPGEPPVKFVSALVIFEA